MRTVCLILILLTTSACTSLRSLNAIGRHPHRVKMAVSSLATNAPATLLHTVRLDIQGRALSILGSTEIATNRLTMAALTPVGGRLFVLRYADGTITYEPSHAFTAPIRPERILLDFFMIYGQGSALAESGMTVLADGPNRRLRTRNGETIHVYMADPNDRWMSSAVYSNALLNYTITITPLTPEPATAKSTGE